MQIDKTEIVATLRSRGLDARADWVDRALPDLVDTDSSASASGEDPNSAFDVPAFLRRHEG